MLLIAFNISQDEKRLLSNPECCGSEKCGGLPQKCANSNNNLPKEVEAEGSKDQTELDSFGGDKDSVGDIDYDSDEAVACNKLEDAIGEMKQRSFLAV